MFVRRKQIRLCQDCRHYKVGDEGLGGLRGIAMCLYFREPVHGSPRFSCRDARAEKRRCGEKGKYWEQKA